jgi:hypothetical protein
MMVHADLQKFSDRQYIAPTFYLLAGKYLSGLNYYTTLQKAVNKFNYLNGLSGGINEVAAGNISFTNDGSAQTAGINCDFYVLVNGNWQLSSYGYLKRTSAWPPVIVRFYKTDTTGPYYAILPALYFGISAFKVSTTDPDKLKALDEFWKEAQVLKYRYNSLAAFLNLLSQKQMNTVEKSIYNEGALLISRMNEDIKKLPGLEFEFKDYATIGIPVLLIIAAIAVLGGTVAWSASQIITEKEKTKRINDSYDLQRWVSDKKIEVAQLATAGQISQTAASNIANDLDSTVKAAQKVADSSSKNSGGVFDNISSIVKWGAVGVLGYSILKTIREK